MEDFGRMPYNDENVQQSFLVPAQEDPDIIKERNQQVVRSVELIQKAQYSLSLQQTRFLQYTISKVKPDDEPSQEYEIQIRNYLDVCGMKSTDSYTAIRDMITKVYQSMVLSFMDEKGNYIITNWYDYCSIIPGKGTIRYRFGSQIADKLIGLARYNATAPSSSKIYYIADELIYSLPLRSRYSHYLYGELRTRKNLNTWTFPIDVLRERLDVFERDDNIANTLKPENKSKRKIIYPRFNDFKRNVLDIAITDINRFTNIKCAYSVNRRRKVVQSVTFYFENKQPGERVIAEHRANMALGTNPGFPVMDFEVPIIFYDATPCEVTTPLSRMATFKERDALNGVKDPEYYRERIKRQIELAKKAPSSKEFELQLLGKHKKRQKRNNTDIDISKYFSYVENSEEDWTFVGTEENIKKYFDEVGGDLASVQNKDGFSGWFFEDLVKNGFNSPNDKIITKKTAVLKYIEDGIIRLESNNNEFKVVIQREQKSAKNFFDLAFKSIFSYRYRVNAAYRYYLIRQLEK